MKKRRLMPEMKEGGVNVTPLIDIVMCLIIFFMLVARIGVTNGEDPSIKIPKAFLGSDIKDPANCLTLNVTNGPIGVTPAYPSITAFRNNAQQEVHILNSRGERELLTWLKDFKDGNPAEHLPANPAFKVIIRGDESMNYQYLQPVLKECSEAGVPYSFATEKAAAVPH
jgi:biopolymer transport protein ExbD